MFASRSLATPHSRGKPAGWTRFVLVLGFLAGLSACLILGMPELYGLLAPETGSRPGAIADPCPGEAGDGESVRLHDARSRVSISVPAGDWQFVEEPATDRVVWRERATRDVLQVRLAERDPGRPRIDYQMHGIAELERCREGSMWGASDFSYGYRSSLVAISFAPTGDGRWLHVLAWTTHDIPRQQELLAAVRTARLAP